MIRCEMFVMVLGCYMMKFCCLFRLVLVRNVF